MCLCFQSLLTLNANPLVKKPRKRWELNMLGIYVLVFGEDMVIDSCKHIEVG